MPPEHRRRRKGDVVATPMVTLTASAVSAAEFLVEEMKKAPTPEHPARRSGAVCLALEEAAERRGWVRPTGES